ncbi:MAG TPA: cupin domain-containing protein [Candidatus Polarisedimenticolia bacterium]|nr:cupin domain-containing protein [Candidatus Polarisedimenticolia bacterium]
MPAHRLKPERTLTDKAGRKICEVLGAADGHKDVSVAWLMLPPGCEGVEERNEFTEVVIILSGRGRASIDARAEEVNAGHSIYVPPGSVWRLANVGPEPLVCYSICMPAFRPELSHVVSH